MIQNYALVDSLDLVSETTEDFSLTFVEDADYEFVGGGNAVNGF